MPHVFYIRHGETDWNAEGRFQGRKEVPLNARGRAQAAAAGAILRGLLTRDRLVAANLDFVSSPLGRAVATTELVRSALALNAEGFRTDERLREISYGDWEGLTREQMQAHDPAHFALRRADNWRIAAPNGESYAEVTERMGAWFRALERDTVVVAHGGTMRALTVALGLAAPHEAVDTPIAQGAVYHLCNGALARYS